MSLRPTQGRIFDQIRSGIQSNTARLIRAQEQASSGKRIVRASDDAIGTSVALSLRRQIGAIESFVASTASARPEVEQASARLQEGTGVLTDIRALMIQGMNGALNARDREAVASQIELLEGQLLDIANTRSGDSYLFSGTDTSTQPFVAQLVGGEERIVYQGNDELQRVLTGRDAEVILNVPGSDIFERYDYVGTRFGDLTGIASGTTADSGRGYEELIVRQDGTTGAMGAGLALGGGRAPSSGTGCSRWTLRTARSSWGAATPWTFPIPCPPACRSSTRVVHGPTSTSAVGTGATSRPP